MSAQVHVLGIRHHGPGSARTLVAALDHLAPDLVLIEGPADADPLVALAAADGMRPPVALLAYDTANPHTAGFWPFAAFSPEWQALQWAARRGVPARFCDLPAAHSLALDRVGAEDRDPLAELAAAGGYDDPERWWDAVVESGGDTGAGALARFDALTEAMAALREGAAVDDRTAQREAHMRQVLRKAQRAGAATVAVVCGAWHAPALVGRLGPAAADTAMLKGLPKVKAALTWVPWTHSRLATASGYGAGVTSPGWYHHLFTEADQPVARWLTMVARELREKDLPVSSAHVIEAVRLADTLAAMRGRPLPGLSEVTEATRAVLCDGDEVMVRFVTDRLVVGEALGQVPEGAPTVPLAADLKAQAKRLRLPVAAEDKVYDLDLRKDTDLGRSHLLHRLRLLGVPWGARTASEVRATGTFRETWTVGWRPELELAAVEASVWGTTVEGAAAARLLDSAHAPGAGLADLTALLEQALLADLTGAVGDLLVVLEAAAALDHDVAHLLAAYPPLARTLRYGDVRNTDTAALAAVADGLLVRACAGLPGAVTSLDDDGAAQVRALLDDTHAAVLNRDCPDGTARWTAALRGLVDRDDVHGTITGRLVRLLRDSGALDGADAAARLSRALSYGSTAAWKAGWVDGFLGGGGTGGGTGGGASGAGLLLVHDRDLLHLLDDWVAGLAAEDFTDVLPLLRRTFGAFEQAERRSLGTVLAQDRSAAPPAPGHHEAPLDHTRAAAALAAVAQLLGAAP